jgi:hypothetical protein
MDLLQAIRLIAMQSVVKPDYEAFLRHVFRWYSREFATPLHEVEDLPIEEILLHYYEYSFEQLDEHERDLQISELLKSDEELAEEKRAEDAKPVEDAEFVKFAQQIQQFKPKPLVVQGFDDEPPETPSIPLPPPMPVEQPPDISMQFDEVLDDNLIPDDVENLNVMRQPEEDE